MRDVRVLFQLQPRVQRLLVALMHARCGGWTVLLLGAFILACQERKNVAEDLGPPPAAFSVQLQVRDEAGVPLEGARVEWGEHTRAAGPGGGVVVDGLMGPVLAVVHAEGHLPEPVPLGREDAPAPVPVRLWAARGGARWVMHSAGDVMFGRRYEAPPEGAPRVPVEAPGPGARAVVEPVRRAFTAASVRTVNLETVVSDLPESAAYPGKRFILRSRPGSLEGLKALSADLVVQANNHARDFLDPGVRDTRAALAAQGLRMLGAAEAAAEAHEPRVLEVNGLRVGVLAWTTVDGTFVNDSYPRDEAPIPLDLAAREAWQYMPRTWGYSGPGLQVPAAARRIGSAWRLFAEAEPRLSEPERALAWQSLVAVYPELQDWVARRGHGGAAVWHPTQSPALIQALAGQVDLVVVQLHSGFQFQEAASANVRGLARAAIDAGADLVVGHHPHVLQGLEWYRERLIAYSLGNFIFDQDFLETFPSAFLRTVWERDRLLEARLVPLELVDYRPVPVVEGGARRTLLRLWERSLLGAETDRDAQGAVRAFAVPPSPETQPAQLVWEHHTARVLPAPPPPRALRYEVPPGATVPLGFDGLVPARLGLGGTADTGVLVGRELLGWGHFEDVLADEDTQGGAHWTLEGAQKHVRVGEAASGERFLRLTRSVRSKSIVVARPVMRIPLVRHRLHARLPDGGAQPLDPAPRYALRLAARLTGKARASLRVALYHFDDIDPTEDPESLLVGEVTRDLLVPPGEGWRTLELELTDALAVEGAPPVNAVLLYLELTPPARGEAALDVDDLEFLEWRPASLMLERFGRYTHVRNEGEAVRLLEFNGLPLSGP